MSTQVATILRAAADRIERDGWCQGTDLADDGSCCMVRAYEDASNGDDDAYVAAAHAMRRHIDATPTVWNDAPGRTVSEVLAALRGAADAVEQGGEL